MRFAFDMLEQSHEDILAQCQQADLVVVPAQSAAGKNEADQLKLPYLSVNFVPWGIPWDDPERPMYKRMIYGAIDRLIGLSTTRPLNRMRKRQGLPEDRVLPSQSQQCVYAEPLFLVNSELRAIACHLVRVCLLLT